MGHVEARVEVLRWMVWRLVLCKHSHNDVGTRSSKVGKVINRSPDASMSVASPSATERGEALLTGAGYAARARKEDATRVWRAAGATSSERGHRSVLGSPVARAGGSMRSPDRRVYVTASSWRLGREQTGEQAPQRRWQRFPSLPLDVELPQEGVPPGWQRAGHRCCIHMPPRRKGWGPSVRGERQRR